MKTRQQRWLVHQEASIRTREALLRQNKVRKNLRMLAAYLVDFADVKDQAASYEASVRGPGTATRYIFNDFRGVGVGEVW